jgi:hypothetical protein
MFIVMLFIQNVHTVTNDGFMLLTIEGKWLKVIMHMIEFEFLNFIHSKQV